jgi:hypothetical protein
MYEKYRSIVAYILATASDPRILGSSPSAVYNCFGIYELQYYWNIYWNGPNWRDST